MPYERIAGWFLAGLLAFAAPILPAAAADSDTEASGQSDSKPKDQAGAKPKDKTGDAEAKDSPDNAGDKSKDQDGDKSKDQGAGKSKDQGNNDKKDSEDKSAKSDKPDDSANKAPDNPAKKPDENEQPKGLWERKNLLGDIGPVRPFLAKYGATLAVIDTNEVLGNVTGGKHQGAIYEGLTDLSLGIDLRPTLHERGNIYARAYQIRGRGLTTTIGNLNEISGIEAAATTRLVEFWYEQHFDYWRIRIGQQTVGTEFFNPEATRLFVNGTFGWPTQPSLDLPSGGPGFPLGTPAIRVRVDPFEGLTIFTALFNGDPTGAGVGGSQLADPSGTAFRTSDGAWVIGEIRYNPDSSDKKGSYRLGAWYNSERFRDLRVDRSGNSLASAASNGQPRLHDGDYTVYLNVDQPLLTNDAEQTRLAVFGRVGVVPSDRNLIDLYADGGVSYKGLFGRPDDRIALGLAYARIGSAARGFDTDVVRFTGSPLPIRSAETVLEATYLFQLTPWLQVQPDFQYVFNPGGGLPSLGAPGKRVGDAAVLGLRTTVTF